MSGCADNHSTRFADFAQVFRAAYRIADILLRSVMLAARSLQAHAQRGSQPIACGLFSYIMLWAIGLWHKAIRRHPAAHTVFPSGPLIKQIHDVANKRRVMLACIWRLIIDTRFRPFHKQDWVHRLMGHLVAQVTASSELVLAAIGFRLHNNCPSSNLDQILFPTTT